MSEVAELLTFYKEIGVEFAEQKRRDPAAELRAVTERIMGCKRCGLHEGKKNYVPGEGSSRPDIMFIGEGPGEREDATGRPFVGNAGELLDKVIAKMGYGRGDVFIGNIVKCRPPGNRDPLRDEVDACLPFLEEQIRVLAPRVIVCLGKVAMNNLLGTAFSIMEKRGSRFDFRGIPVIPTYHPAYILHKKGKDEVSKAKWEMWRDMEKVLAIVRG